MLKVLRDGQRCTTDNIFSKEQSLTLSAHNNMYECTVYSVLYRYLYLVCLVRAERVVAALCAA